MSKLKIKTHTTKDKLWVDDNGVTIPLNRVTKAERLKERGAASMLKEAIALNKRLVSFKDTVETKCEEIATAVLAELNTEKEHKGNFTFYNFDRSIKINVDVSNRISFDDLTIMAAKEKLDAFLDANVEAPPLVKSLVLDAFKKTKGKMDVKKVLSLMKYKDQVKDSLFSEAINLIQKAIIKKDSKLYFRIWALNESGEFEAINLNFSHV